MKIGEEAVFIIKEAVLKTMMDLSKKPRLIGAAMIKIFKFSNDRLNSLYIVHIFY